MVHLRRKRERLLEVSLQIACHRDEDNSKSLDAIYKKFRDLLFPGVKDKEDKFLEDGKRILAEEAKKVYIIKPAGASQTERLQRAAWSPNPAMRDMAREQIRREADAQAALKRRMSRGRRAPPGSVRG